MTIKCSSNSLINKKVESFEFFNKKSDLVQIEFGILNNPNSSIGMFNVANNIENFVFFFFSSTKNREK